MNTQPIVQFIADNAITIIGFCIIIGVYKQKIEALEKKVDKHNNVIERVFRIEENVRHIDIGALQESTKRNAEDIKELKEALQCRK